MPKPKKGVMPPALKKYWAKRRELKAKIATASNSAKRRSRVVPGRVKEFDATMARYLAATEPKKRRKNPTPVELFRLAIRRGGDRLFLNRGGEKFSKIGPHKRFSTRDEVNRAAIAVAKKYPSLVKGWKFYIVTS